METIPVAYDLVKTLKFNIICGYSVTTTTRTWNTSHGTTSTAFIMVATVETEKLDLEEIAASKDWPPDVIPPSTTTLKSTEASWEKVGIDGILKKPGRWVCINLSAYGQLIFR